MDTHGIPVFLNLPTEERHGSLPEHSGARRCQHAPAKYQVRDERTTVDGLLIVAVDKAADQTCPAIAGASSSADADCC